MTHLVRAQAQLIGAALFVVTMSVTVVPIALAAAASPDAHTAAPVPAAGDTIPPFEVEGLDGKTVKIDFPKGSKTVLVFFSSTCPVCHRMLPEWSRAFKEKKPGITMYGIVLDRPDPAFFIMTPLDFPVFRSPGREFLASIKVQRVPTTMRVAAGGKVVDAAQGQIDRMRVGQFFTP